MNRLKHFSFLFLVFVLTAAISAGGFNPRLIDMETQPATQLMNQDEYYEGIIEGSDDTQKITTTSPMLPFAMSLALPGAGQFYQENYWRAAIFTGIEAIALVTYFIYDDEGDTKTSEYKEFADTHYSREDWRETAETMAITVGKNDETTFDQSEDGDEVFYIAEQYNGWVIDSTVAPNWENFFMLDEDNTLHYYEDIGKYDKYIFGWDDWQAEYATQIANSGGSPEAYWESGLIDRVRIGKDAITGEDFEYEDKDFDFENGFHTDWTPNRDKYNSIRKEADDAYDIASTCENILVINHVASALEAFFTQRSINKSAIIDMGSIEKQDKTLWDKCDFDLRSDILGRDKKLMVVGSFNF